VLLSSLATSSGCSGNQEGLAISTKVATFWGISSFVDASSVATSAPEFCAIWSSCGPA